MPDKRQDNELSPEEHEFLHKMFTETFDFDKWADDMDEAIEKGKIEIEPKQAEDNGFDLDDLF